MVFVISTSAGLKRGEERESGDRMRKKREIETVWRTEGGRGEKRLSGVPASGGRGEILCPRRWDPQLLRSVYF